MLWSEGKLTKLAKKIATCFDVLPLATPEGNYRSVRD